MNTIEESIRHAVREEMRGLSEKLERLLGGGSAQDLQSVPKAAKACSVSADTVRRRYLPRLKRYGAGRCLRISVSDLRRVMAEDGGEGLPAASDVADRIANRKRRGH